MASDEGSYAPTAMAIGSDRPLEGGRFGGRYLVLRLLGRGGMGSVFAVADTQLGEEVALKVLESSPGSGDSVERFRREVRLARRITHRNVARIFDIGEHAGAHYLTMELIAGESLADRIARARLDVAQACAVMAEVAQGLAAAHATGVVHRDLKPANVLVERHASGSDAIGRAVITDFGIACALSGDVRLTRDGGAWIGTPAYMSPEQLRGDALDAKSDLYAFGVMLFELITGELPFVGEGPVQIAMARLTHPPVDPRTRTSVDDGLAELVLSCLAIDPAQRPASAEQLAERLGAYARDHADRHAVTDASQTMNATLAMSRVAPTFAATTVGTRGVAVLPFRYRGPAADEYLAEALTDELIDLLSMTRGLRVAARGATAAFTGTVDPRAIGRELGVDAVVEGAVQRAGEDIRISARLITVDTGFQTWSERFDGRLADVFELQDRLAKRVAESLRLELETDTFRAGVPQQAIELYLRARTLMRTLTQGGDGADGAIALLEGCLELAPHFRPAIAAMAVACERRWFVPAIRDADHRVRAEVAVARALAEAPELAESHLAAARHSMQRAEFGIAARELATALSIAPTFPAAHEALGSLQCEAARPTEGLRHLQLAAALDPTSAPALVYLVRFHELRGDQAAADAALVDVQRRCGGWEVGLVGMDARIGAWRGDRERVRAARDRALRLEGAAKFIDLLFAGYLGEIGSEQLEQLIAMALHTDLSPRFRSLICQVGAEGLAVAGDHARAAAMIQRAVDDALVDLEWLEQCPVLAGVRTLPEYAPMRERVRARAEAIWMVE